MKFRKLTAIAAVLSSAVLVSGVLSGCGGSNDSPSTPDISDTTSAAEEISTDESAVEESASDASTEEESSEDASIPDEASVEASSVMPADYTPTGGEFFEYEIMGDIAEIYKYTGKDTDVRIPMEIDGHKISCVRTETFDKNTTVKSLTVPYGVDIGNLVTCSSLEKFVTYNGHLGKVFSDRTGEIFSHIKEVEINGASEDVTLHPNTIGKDTFRNCSDLKKVVINAKLIGEIGDGAFVNCTNLETVEINGDCSLYQIGSLAFANCTSLKAFDLSKNQSERFGLMNSSFWNCTSLTEFYVPDNCLSISDHAFLNCNSLKKVIVAGESTSIGDFAIGYTYKDGIPESTMENVPYGGDPYVTADESNVKVLDGFVLYDTGKGSTAHKYAVDNGLTDNTIGE